MVFTLEVYLLKPSSHNILLKTEFNNQTWKTTNTALNLSVDVAKSPIKKSELHPKAYILCFCIMA